MQRYKKFQSPRKKNNTPGSNEENTYHTCLKNANNDCSLYAWGQSDLKSSPGQGKTSARAHNKRK